MNDNTIINIISKIHFILTSALSFIFLTLSIIFILLQNGIYLENISIANVKVDRLYIKWNEKINLIVKEINISNEKTSSKIKIDYLKINKILKSVQLFDNWFEQISIEKIKFNDMKSSFRYIEGKNGFLMLSSKSFVLNTTLSFDSHLFRVHIDKFNHYKKDIKISGDLILNNTDVLELSSLLHLNIHNDIKLDIYSLATKNKLYYKANFIKDITSIKHIVNILNLDKRVQYWVYDAIDMQSLSIKSANGFFEYDKLDEAINNIKIKAVVNSLNYTYHKDIDAVKTEYTDLEFKNSILYIKPHDTNSYSFDLARSWLKIDFSKKAEILTLHLLFNGSLNSDMLHILNTYKIKIPFIQKEGIIDTNLRLIVNLRTLDVDALGIFTTKEAKINYLGLDIDVFNTDVHLNNFDVKVKDMFAKYKDIASANVDLDFNAKNSIGTMDFKFNKIFLQEQNLNLNQNELNVSYLISPKQDYINIGKSTWRYLNEEITVDYMRVPFNLKKLNAEIPISNIEVKNMAKLNLFGNLIIEPLNLDLDISLEKLNIDDINLQNESIKLKLEFNEIFKLSSNDDIQLKYNDKAIELKHLDLNIIKNELNIKELYINYDDSLISTIDASYKLSENIGKLNIENIHILDSSLGNIFKNSNNSTIRIEKKGEDFVFRSSEFDIDYILSKKEWNLKLNSLLKLTNHSKLLQKYKLDNGNLTLYSKKNSENIKFLANIKYPYKILVNNNTPITNYIVHGEKNIDKISFNINNSVDIEVDDTIDIQANNIGLDVSELIKIFDTNSTKNSNNTIEVSANATNCYIYLSKDRHAISENIKFSYKDKILKAQLMHKKGIAWFELNNNQFTLHGNNFGYEFMQELFALSKFEKGTLEFSIFGSPSEYDGVIYMQDTIIHDYVLLNNVLAFVNTIPSLITFSLPGYSQHGLYVDNAYINFKYKNNIYNMSDISLKSKELSILGKGSVSIKRNKIDLDLNLKTDLGSSISKIPLVGYILLGEDTISTSLKIEGKLNDPTINTRVAKDIAVAPLNIIKRTFLLPFNLLTGKK